MKKTSLLPVVFCMLVLLLSSSVSTLVYAQGSQQTAIPNTVLKKTTQDNPPSEKPLEEKSSVRFDVPPPVPREKPRQKIWEPDEINKANLLCDKILGEWTIEAKKLPALGGYEGCGDPAPLLVSRFLIKTGENRTPVEINPPATLNCKMAGRIARWIRDTVQPASKEYFNMPVTKIHNVASYHCRKRYNANKGKMSEHGFANALDISSFTLSDDSKISVLGDWEPIKKEAERQEEPTDMSPQHKASAHIASAQAAPLQNAVKVNSQEEGHKESVESAFLKKIHKGACGKFSTVLGPESNTAHADHFHLDLGRNGRYQICE